MKPKKVNTLVVGDSQIDHCIFTSKKGALVLEGVSTHDFTFENFDDFPHIISDIKENSGKNKYLYIIIIAKEIIKNVNVFKQNIKNPRSQILNFLKEDFEISLADYYIDYMIDQHYDTNVVYTNLSASPMIVAYSAAIPRSMCDKVMEVISDEGFKTLGMETDTNALFRLGKNVLGNKTFLHLHVRNIDCTLYISSSNVILVERELNIGIREILSTIQSNAGADPEQARQALFEYGLNEENETEEDENKFKAISEAVDKISLEIQRTIDYYFQQFSAEQIQSILITGDILKVPNYGKYVQNLFNIETVCYEASKELTLDIDEKIDFDELKYITESIGLGMKIL